MLERMREQIELDSMDFLDIVMELRKRYGVQVPEEEYQELATLRGCVEYRAPKLAAQELVTAGCGATTPCASAPGSSHCWRSSAWGLLRGC